MNGTLASPARPSLVPRIDRLPARIGRMAAPVFCFVFGSLLLIFVLAPADGVWQLYAERMLRGDRLYSDLGLNQQPLFFIVSKWSLAYAPDTILGQRLVFVIVLGLYVYLLDFISHFVTDRPVHASVLQLAVFFTAIHAEFFRFDDYHALAHVGVLASIASSLLFASGRQTLTRYAIFQGAVATLVFLTRVNEGLAIAASVGCLVLVRHGASRAYLRFVGLGLLMAVATLAAVLLLTGETPATWLQSTLVEASSAKGGASLFSYPYGLILDSAFHFGRIPFAPLPILLASIPIGLVFARILLRTLRWSNVVVAVACVFFTFVVAPGHAFILFATLIPTAVLGLVAFTSFWSIRAAVRAIRQRGEQELWWPLSFYPLFLFLLGSLSTGGKAAPLYFPLAVALLLFPIVVLGRLKPAMVHGARTGFILLCTLLAVAGAWTRYQNPYSWLDLHVSPLGKGYSYRDDTRRGGHFITDELAALIDPVCARVGPGDTLLSTPFSFANYYCGVPTWRGYVQTWFDLSTEAKIDRLLEDLEQGPPDYVYYQKQEGVLRHHELVFNEGRPLPYRKLDAYIVDKVVRGEWETISRSRQFKNSHWLLIRTASTPSHFRAGPRAR